MRRFAFVIVVSIAALGWNAAHLSFDSAPRPSSAPSAEPTDRLVLPEFAPPAAAPEAPLSDAGWLASIERSLAAREYEATVNHRGLQTPNREQNLRTYFEPEGI